MKNFNLTKYRNGHQICCYEHNGLYYVHNYVKDAYGRNIDIAGFDVGSGIYPRSFSSLSKALHYVRLCLIACDKNFD